MTGEHPQPAHEPTGEAVCERCGAPATFQAVTAICQDGVCRSGESHSWCKPCARVLGEYPRRWQLIPAFIMMLALLPFRGYLRRKYPREYWEQKLRDIENQDGSQDKHS